MSEEQARNAELRSMMLLISKSADAASKSRCQSKAENEINTTGTISEYEEKLKSSGFVRCYRSILVNPHHIKAYNVVSKEFSMSTGTRLPVSRSYAVQAVTAYNRAKNGDGRL